MLVLGVEDDVVEREAAEADCEDDVKDVCPLAVETELGELVAVAVTVPPNVGIPLPPSVVLLLAIATEFEELGAAAVTVPSDVGISLPLSVVLLLAEHCPTYAQYCPLAQHIGPHDACPNPPLQLGSDGTAAATVVVEVCVEEELAGAETGTEEGD